MVFGLALIMALMFGVASVGLAANGQPFLLGKAKHTATAEMGLIGKVAGGPALRVSNPSGGTALGLQVNSGQAPLAVNAEAGNATNLDADKLDGKDSAEFLGANQKAADSDTLDGQDSPAFLNGQLITTLQDNLAGAPNGSTGYINVISNYTPPVNATAGSFVRCSYDGSAAGQTLVIRAAICNPSVSGDVTVRNSFYIPVTTPGANMSVLNQNSDTFQLSAGQSYDFGVNIASAAPTPSCGSQTDFCTATVLVFRR